MSSTILVITIGLCFGFLAASGVLTVLLAVGLLPRYIGRLHEAKHVILFENLVVSGSISGTLVSLFGYMISDSGLGLLGTILEVLYGLFAGIFVGTLAIAIAEMLDAFPIFFRRSRVQNGLRYILLAVAFGKAIGAFVYFYFRIYETVAG